MLIEPNTNIRLLKNVPLDNTYTNTLWFDNTASQTNYFSGMTKHNLTQQSYQRVKKGVARVGLSADNCYDCNYMMFQNTSYGVKWFYGFITAVEYINDTVCEITFEIDVMQTWLKDFDIKQCFVEREHSLTDTIGSYITDEPVNVGEYVVTDYEELGIGSVNWNDMLVIVSIVDVDKSTSGNLYDGIYSGTELWCYQSTDVQNINTLVGSYIQSPDSIVSMYMCPAILIPNVPIGGTKLSYGQSGIRTNVTLDKVSTSMLFGSYKPKNNKLYTYPYNYLSIDNASGNSLPLRYEFFDELTPVVEITGTISQPVKIVARPCSYKGVNPYSEIGGYTTYNPESISMESYPMCSWNVDAYKAWLAQNSVPIVLDTVSSIANMGVASTYSAHPVGSIVSGGISTATNVLSQAYKASISADICRGTVNNGGVNTATGKQKLYCGRVHVTEQYAMIIDNFFTMYGYATNRVKTPYRTTRPHWNYVKTSGCVITGSVPADDMRTICNIHDKGVTYWKNGNEIGNYLLDNAPM